MLGFPSYVGPLCESLNCEARDPPQCANYSANQCTLRLVNHYCPKLCDRCPAANPKCPSFKQCVGGYFSNDTCACMCYPNWSGELCEQLMCNATLEPPACANYTEMHCNFQEVYEYCPVMCGSCNGTQSVNMTNMVDLPVMSSSIAKKCLNGGSLHSNGSCLCNFNFLPFLFLVLR